MEIEKQSSDAETRIAIAGELTLSCAVQLRTKLLECIESGNPVLIDLDRVSEVDLACLQVLLGARNSFARCRRRLAMKLGETVGTAWAEAGYPAGEASSG